MTGGVLSVRNQKIFLTRAAPLVPSATDLAHSRRSRLPAFRTECYPYKVGQLTTDIFSEVRFLRAPRLAHLSFVSCSRLLSPRGIKGLAGC